VDNICLAVLETSVMDEMQRWIEYCFSLSSATEINLSPALAGGVA
jgi:hypothetical protein